MKTIYATIPIPAIGINKPNTSIITPCLYV